MRRLIFFTSADPGKDPDAAWRVAQPELREVAEGSAEFVFVG